ncbi:MAG: Stp1/IreP family PP2C-type Ser/Thr phosphatase [Methylococcaceae bacterium]|nr:Stp1/IreP family PP2C-type Ser/Thr phosphatase [Methylococcaceae bacterium]
MRTYSFKFEVGAKTDKGCVRTENQDRMSWVSSPLGQLFVVADGMGGHNGGAKAAELTVDGLVNFLAETQNSLGIEDAIRGAFEKTNQTIYQQAHSGDPATEGMGSTAVLLLVYKQIAKIAHVGDSRVYLFRNGKLSLLTKDHTLVQKMVDAGMLTPEQARNHPSASLLDRAMGNRAEIAVEIHSDLRLKAGDGILLCSDGLSGYVEDQDIEAALTEPATAQEYVDRLLELAYQKGGEDNITIQFIRVFKKPKSRLEESFKKLLNNLFVSLLILCGIGCVSYSAYYLSRLATPAFGGGYLQDIKSSIVKPFQQASLAPTAGLSPENQTSPHLPEQEPEIIQKMSAMQSELSETHSELSSTKQKLADLEKKVNNINIPKHKSGHSKGSKAKHRSKSNQDSKIKQESKPSQEPKTKQESNSKPLRPSNGAIDEAAQKISAPIGPISIDEKK